MSKFNILFLLINIFISNIFAEIKYGENTLIYQDNGSIFNFLYVKFYQSKNEIDIRTDRHINLDSDNMWILFDPDNLDNISNIKYGDKIKLSVFINSEKFYINQNSSKTEIKKYNKRKPNNPKIISSYYGLNSQKEANLDSQDIQTLGVFKILNSLSLTSTSEVDDSRPVILKLETDSEEDEYLSSTLIIDYKPILWYIKPERLL